LTRGGLWGIALLGLIGCGGRAAQAGAGANQGPAPAPQALQDGHALFRRGEWEKANAVFRRVAFEVAPGDSQAVEAQYFQAECQYQLGQRVEAAHQFRRVADESPASRWAPLALLRAGDANADLWNKPVLDPSYGQAAIATWQELIGRYPESSAAARAQIRIRRITEQLAEKQYLNAMFYARRKFYDSAILYFKELVALYPQSRRVPDALIRLVEIYRVVDYQEELKETCEHLRRFYPAARGLEESCPAAATGSR